MIRRFAEHAARFELLSLFPFSGFQMASWLHCSLASVVNGRENDDAPFS